MNKLEKCSKVFVMFFILHVILLIFSPNRIVGRSAIQKDDIKLHVYAQATTGAPQKISKSDLAILKEKIKDTYPNVKSTDIELEGDTPFHHVDDPAYIGEFTVYGKVIGTTLNETSGENTVAVLKVSYWDMPMIQYWFYEGSIPSLSLAILSPFLFIALSILYARPKKADQR
ncbi:transposase [Bacillus paramycoides]|uniref:Transposase n=1 Tax=Bacillus paramycoides TaxID=2026194 RepID=A0A1J9U130_9BACI|nr:transposase [Bacillus paramycoides]MED1107902.1 transposase [Bacillus paramycoides]OJD72302.1 transposase [Bacillus paramycoides]